MYRSFLKIISVITCVLLIVSFSSCASTKDVPKDKGPSETEITKEDTKGYEYTGNAPVTEQKKQISVLTSNGASLVMGFVDMPWWKEIFNRANVELIVDEIDASSYEDVLKPRLAAAIDLPDIVKVGSDNDMSYINSGIFLELTDYYEKYGYNIKKQFEKHKYLKSEITTPDGKIYYMPFITYATSLRTPMINMGYLNSLGMTEKDLNTIDDYYDFLVKVRDNDLNGDGDKSDEVPLFMRSGWINTWSMYWGLQLADTKGFQIEPDGKVICGYADERYKDFLAYFNKLYKEGLLFSEYATANLDMQNALLSNNQIGSILHFVSNCSGYSTKIKPDWNFYEDDPIMLPLIPPLKGPYGDQYVYGKDTLGALYGISKDCKDPDTVFCFADYLYSDEVGVLAWYGIEGEDYNMVNGEYVFTPEFLKNADGYRTNRGYSVEALPGYQLDGGKNLGNCKTVNDISYALYDNYLLMPSIVFSYKLPEENEVLQAYSADLNTYFLENIDAFIMGTRPLSDWDKYISDMKKMGLAEVIAVYQTNADRSAALEK
jgi:putative aldouronate transport system substrate-binding protein